MKMRQCTSSDPGLKLLLSHGVWCWHHTEHKYMIMNLPGSECFVLNIGGLSEEDFFCKMVNTSIRLQETTLYTLF